MNHAPHPFLLAALLFVQAATSAYTQDDPPVQIPKVAFTEVRTDTLKRLAFPDEEPTYEVRASTETTIVLKFPLVDFDPASVDESTSVGISAGGFSHDATLGDSVNWSSGKNRAKFPLLEETDEVDDEGNPIQKRIGTVRYAWSQKKLIVTVIGRRIGGIVADSAEDFFADVDGSKVRFLEPIEASVTFGDQTGSTSLYAKGVAKKVTKTRGSGDAAEFFDLYFLNAVSYRDKAPPTVRLFDPADGAEVDSEFLTLTGTATDNVDSPSSLTLTKVLLNGVDVTEAVFAEFTDGDDTQEPPLAPGFVVDGIELTARENTIQLFVADSSGNTTIVTRRITYTGGAAADTTPPVVSIDDPVEGAVVDSDTLSLFGTATDNLDAASSLEVTQVFINGADVTLDVTWFFEDGDSTVVPAVPGSIVVDGLLLDEGPNTIVITVSDQAGNTTVVTRHVTYFVQP